ncbi:MAG: OmpA family protein [Candidatus Cloacimonetes bacterium]|nr:OmpA family protein [Candidatus Cloacimonadota bacterium]
MSIFSFNADRLKSMESHPDWTEEDNWTDTLFPFANLMILILVFTIFYNFYTLNQDRVAHSIYEIDTTNVITLQGNLFGKGEAVLLHAAEKELFEVASAIMEKMNRNGNWQIRVEGHTSNIPLRNHPSYASNWDLSVTRANAIARFFIQNDMFAPDQIQIMGYGGEKPKVPNDRDENRKLNERIEIRLVEVSAE